MSSSFNRVDVVVSPTAASSGWQFATVGATPTVIVSQSFLQRAGRAAMISLMALAAISYDHQVSADSAEAIEAAQSLLGDMYNIGMSSAYRALVAQ